MPRKSSILSCALLIGSTASLTLADPAGPLSPVRCGVRVINGGNPAVVTVTESSQQAISYPLQSSAAALTVGGAVVAPAAIVSRDLAMQPTYSGLATLQIADNYTIIDPYADYRRHDSPAGLDSNHSIVRAGRLYQSLNAGPTSYVLQGGKPEASAEPAADRPVQPIMIIPKPMVPPADVPLETATPAPASPAPVAAPAAEPVKPLIPTVPAAPKEHDDQLVAVAR